MLKDILQKLNNDIDYCTKNLPDCEYARGYIEALQNTLSFIEDKVADKSYTDKFKINKDNEEIWD